MLTEENYEDLKVKGYTVVSDVLTTEECDKTVVQYRDWLSQFKDGGWPYSGNSLIQKYNTGNMEPTWFVRLKSKKVFAQIWKTDKLLSSCDAIAIGRPPEEGQEKFHRVGDHWLHLDQNWIRDGLHAYQGAVYLEEACEEDWTLQVMEGSHLHFDDVFENNPKAKKRTDFEFNPLSDKDVIEMKKRGCNIKRVPVPKGGIVLWDSRLVHANANPVKGRKNAGRWRFCVFVCMTPAIWASKEDMEMKKDAYEQAFMTTHWPSQRVSASNSYIPSYAPQNILFPKELPEIARTREAKLLSGVIPYDFKDGNPTGEEFRPKWRGVQYYTQRDREAFVFKMKLGIGAVTLFALMAGIGYGVYTLKNK